MRKTFCDCCGKEMTDQIVGSASAFRNVNHRPQHQINDLGNGIPVKVELNVICTLADPTDICDECKWKAVDRIDPRPTAASVTNLRYEDLRRAALEAIDYIGYANYDSRVAQAKGYIHAIASGDFNVKLV